MFIISNIVIFSSGISEQRGVVSEIKDALTEYGHVCSDWRMLFSNANDPSNIALLPMLCKKIPSFDYAVLICEGHDTMTIYRTQGKEIVRTMRDNVLFEIGLSAMALGVSKTIIVAEPGVHLPDDLVGKNGQLAVKRIFLSAGKVVADQINDYIKETCEEIHQVVIGAAYSTASAILGNFICKVLAHIDQGIYPDTKKDPNGEVLHIPIENIHMHIRIVQNPEGRSRIDDATKDLLNKNVMASRSFDFKCYFEGDQFHIVDYPSNIETTYDTAKMILHLDADDTQDTNAEQRFVSKEIRLYEASLKSMLNRETVTSIVRKNEHNATKEAQDHMIDQIMEVLTNRFTIERIVL